MAKRKKRISTTIAPQTAQKHNPFIEAYEASYLSNKPKIQEHEKERAEELRRTARLLKFNEEETESFVISELRNQRYIDTIRQPLVATIEDTKRKRVETRQGKRLLKDVPDLLLQSSYAKHRGKRDWLKQVTNDLIRHRGGKEISSKCVRAELEIRRIVE